MDAALSALLRQNAQDLGSFYFAPQKPVKYFLKYILLRGASSYQFDSVYPAYLFPLSIVPHTFLLSICPR